MKKAPKPANTRNRKAATKPIPVEWLTQAKAAAVLSVTPRQFQNYEIPPAGRRGRFTYYQAADLVQFAEDRAHRRGYEAGLRDARAALPENAAELLAARDLAELRLTEERAEGQRLKNAELRRELVPVELLTWALSDLASQIVPLLTSIPGDMKRRSPKLTHQDIHVMREVIANALNLVAEVRIDWDGYEPDEPAG